MIGTLWFRIIVYYRIFVYCLSLFTTVCHARSALDFAADLFGKFYTSPSDQYAWLQL